MCTGMFFLVIVVFGRAACIYSYNSDGGRHASEYIRVEMGKKGETVRTGGKKIEIEICKFSRRTILIRYVLYARRPSVDSRVLLDPHSRYSGSAKVPPRRYSGSKMLTTRRDSSNSQVRKEKRAHYDGSNSARMLLGQRLRHIAR